MAVVPYRQDQAPCLDFWGSDIRNHTTEGDTLWVNYTTSHFSEDILPRGGQVGLNGEVIASYVTVIPRSARRSSTSRKLRPKRW